MMCGTIYLNTWSPPGIVLYIFKFLHRIYLTLARLTGVYAFYSAVYWHCVHSPDTFSHIFWHFPVVQKFWLDVTRYLSNTLMTSIPQMIAVGLVEGVASTTAHRTLLSVLLFYARKAIILHWGGDCTYYSLLNRPGQRSGASYYIKLAI